MSIVKSTLGLHTTTVKPSELDFTRNSVATRVNAIGLIENVPANTIRQDFKPDITGELQGWLLEQASTNLSLHSQDFSNAAWSTGAQTYVNGNNTLSPNGLEDADHIYADSVFTGQSFVKQTGMNYVDGTKYSISVFVKKTAVLGMDFLEISNSETAGGSNTFSQTFNLGTGNLGSSTGAVNTSDTRMVSYPNGWYRCEVSFTAASGGEDSVCYLIRKADGNSSDETFGTGEGLYLWGSQVEAVEYSTSYIPTTDSAMLREADVASYTVTDEDYNWTVGCSLVMRGRTYGGAASTPIFHYGNTVGVDGGAPNDDSVTWYNNGSVKVMAGGESQTTANPQSTGLSVSKHSDFGVAITLEPNRLHVAQNGVLATNGELPDTSITMPKNVDDSNFAVKFFHGDGTGSGHLQAFHVIPNKLTDYELQDRSFSKTELSVTMAQASGSALVDGAVTTSKLAANAVTSDKIAHNAITSEHLKVNVIVAEDIAANAITVSELANDSVETAKILDLNVTEGKLADGSVTSNKISLSNEATGDLMYYSNGQGWIRLPKGQDGYILKASTTGDPLQWVEDQGAAPTDPTTQIGTHGDSHVSGTIANTYINPNKVGITELNVSDGNNGQALMTDGNGVLSFGDVSADPTMGGDLSGTTSNAQLVANAVTATELADDAVTTAKILNANVSNIKIADDAVNADKLRDSTTTDSERAVTTNHIRNSAITADKLANDSVTTDKIADDAILNAQLADNSVWASTIHSNAVTNIKIAANAVTNSKLATDAVTNSKIADGAITAGKIAAGVIVAQDIAANAVGVTELNVSDGTNGQVLTTNGAGTLSFTTPAAGDPAVGGAFTGTVSNIQIPDNTITSAMIAADVIVAEDLANNSITVAELSDGAVATAKIADNAVNGTKIAMGSDAAGDIMYFNGTDYTRLPVGTSGQVLTMNAGGSAPEWAATSATAATTNVGGDLSGTVENAQIIANAVGVAELNVTDGSTGQVLQTDGAGNLSFTTVSAGGGTDVAMAIALG